MRRRRISPWFTLIVVVTTLGVAGVAFTLLSVWQAPPSLEAAPKHEDFRETITQDVGDKKIAVTFDMVAISGGEFLMGSPDSEEDRKLHEGPQAKVKIKPFWLGKCEVTWDEFDLYYAPAEAQRRFWDDKKGKDGPDAVSRPTQSYVDETYGHERNKHPVISISHHAAMTYCEWLAKKTGKPYRLPTEAEWEYACRVGTTSPHGIPNGHELDRYAWYKANSVSDTHPRGTTHEVGTKKPNAWGLHDMHGNVMEWCLDHYVENAYSRFNKQLDKAGFALMPKFPPTDNKWYHVTRGGHFGSEPKDLRSAARVASHQEWLRLDPQEPQSIWWLTKMDNVGFRVCLSLDDDELKGMTSKVARDNNSVFKPR